MDKKRPTGYSLINQICKCIALITKLHATALIIFLQQRTLMGFIPPVDNAGQAKLNPVFISNKFTYKTFQESILDHLSQSFLNRLESAVSVV